MKCKECNTRMYVSDSNEANNVRFRRYTCPKCDNQIYTQETLCDAAIGRPALNLRQSMYYQKRQAADFSKIII